MSLFRRSPRQRTARNFKSVLESLKDTNIEVLIAKSTPGSEKAVKGFIVDVDDDKVHVNSDQFVETSGFLAVVIVPIDEIKRVSFNAPEVVQKPVTPHVVAEPNLNGVGKVQTGHKAQPDGVA